MKFKKKALVLVHPALIPPESIPNGKQQRAPWQTEYDVISNLKQFGHKVEVVGLKSDLFLLRQSIDNFRPHIVFNLLEEFDGEALFDQNVVSYLQLLRQAYTGCSPAGLLLARDKGLSKKILSYHRIPVPHFFVAPLGKRPRLSNKIRYPLIVKGLNEEGSLGISQASVVYDQDKLLDRITFIHDQLKCDAIAEEYIDGREFYVSIIGNKNIKIFPPRELKFSKTPSHIHKIATERVKWNSDYRDKYGIDSHEVNDLGKEKLAYLRRLCRRTYKALQLDGYARIDLRQDHNGHFYVIEANPNPDLSKGEDFALSAQQSRLSYPELLNQIIHIGLRKSWLP